MTIRVLLADDQALVRSALAALDGSTVAATAGQLHLSPGTVRNHLSQAIGKTGAATRVGAARHARHRGWL